jgi:hypothetical protein
MNIYKIYDINSLFTILNSDPQKEKRSSLVGNIFINYVEILIFLNMLVIINLFLIGKLI